jgi:hypothetical protein
MDRAAIFADVTRRNALRRANGLPPLEIRTEYEHQVAVAAQADFRAFCDRHAGEREAIRQAVLSELRVRYGADFGNTMGGRWAIGEFTRRRFKALMEIKQGAIREQTEPTRNLVIYGETPEGRR